MRIFEPNLAFRLVFVSGGNFFADWIEFESVVSVEAETWGAIKSLFR